mmetsp:Transcript_8312/g.15411  ORF Transcript_8312/g.15411 Transcript_8312/m.15411 type:complete len:334 (-) Transcript_8312:298-1299(-)|eukprot:CAMPEP_0197519742 /NCGR_PEP_ID=MMETSP1318-20131121/5018_1 /TAXON_ID=552666 /ORGANISM="Partenskyella glossopodia, Strain RCC365" /LENGTH=333 /DNA_ID=CAMNT_0043070899 /DNA_START=90 /DNA_END=1091 /DNA_ORIENTATION=-
MSSSSSSPDTLKEASLLIQKLADADPLTPRWVEIVEIISPLAKFVQEEREAKTLPQSPVVMSLLRHKKVYLLVHMFETYRNVVKDEKLRQTRVKKMVDDGNKDILSTMKTFEMDSHTILNHALKFLMVQQRINFNTVLSMYAGMLEDCLQPKQRSKEVLAAGADFTCFAVLKSLLRTVVHLGEFEESRMTSPIKKTKLVPLIIKTLHSRMKVSRAFAAAAGVMFLDTIMDSDDFTTEPDEFIDDELKPMLIEVQVYIATPLYKLGMLKRKPRHLAKWATRYKMETESKDIDEELAKAIVDQLQLTAKMKTGDSKKPTQNQLKYSTKKRTNIIF